MQIWFFAIFLIFSVCSDNSEQKFDKQSEFLELTFQDKFSTNKSDGIKNLYKKYFLENIYEIKFLINEMNSHTQVNLSQFGKIKYIKNRENMKTRIYPIKKRFKSYPFENTVLFDENTRYDESKNSQQFDRNLTYENSFDSRRQVKNTINNFQISDKMILSTHTANDINFRHEQTACIYNNLVISKVGYFPRSVISDVDIEMISILKRKSCIDFEPNHLNIILGEFYTNFILISRNVDNNCVFKANEIKTNKIVAIKILILNSKDEIHEIPEIKASFKLKHRNIINIQKVFKCGAFLFCIMDFFPCTLKNYPLKKEKIQEILLNIIDIVQYMHSQSVAHGDINDYNILISDDGMVKLIDFRKCFFVSQEKMENYGFNYFCEPFLNGTKFEQTEYQFSKDIFQIGVLIFEIYTGDLFDYLEYVFIKQFCSNLHLAGKNLLREKFIDFHIKNEKIANIIKMCCYHDYRMRISISDLKIKVHECDFSQFVHMNYFDIV